MIKELNNSSRDLKFNNVNGILFFSLNKEIWQTDGTETGTRKVIDVISNITDQPNSIPSGEILNINDTLLFFSYSWDSRANTLWTFKSDTSVQIGSPVCEAGLDPQTIKAGEGTALWWWSQNVITASIDNGIGEISIPSDYLWIYPTETTTFTMAAKGANGATTTCKTTLIVEAAGSPPPICEIGADPQVITAGEGTALWWWSNNVTSATINNAKWSVAVPSDYAWFYPIQTATYTMTAQGEDGTTATCSTTIMVK